jgi:serine/threonine protein kinase
VENCRLWIYSRGQFQESAYYYLRTCGYRSPELLSEAPKYTTKADIWGLGCILYELVTFNKAFAEDWKVRDYAHGMDLEIHSLAFGHRRNVLLTELISAMLSIDSSLRPSARQVREATIAWFNDRHPRIPETSVTEMSDLGWTMNPTERLLPVKAISTGAINVVYEVYAVTWPLD